MDVLAVEEAAARAALAVRSGGGPCFLEFRTYRFRPHSAFDPELYRSKQEVEAWKTRDPIATLTARLSELQLADDGALAALEAEVAREVEAAIAFAEAGHLEPVEDLARFVYSEPGKAGAAS
jgi:TPP-dependent pyruvate/acetoin dehydrogenase alpha subunit